MTPGPCPRPFLSSVSVLECCSVSCSRILAHLPSSPGSLRVLSPPHSTLGGAEGRLRSSPGRAIAELVPHAGTWRLSCCPLRRDRGRSSCLRALHLLVQLEPRPCPAPSPVPLPRRGQLAFQPSLGPALPQCPRDQAPRQLCAQLPPPQAPTLLLPRCGEPGEAPGLETCHRLMGYTQGRLIYRQLAGQHRGTASCLSVCLFKVLSWPGAGEGFEKPPLSPSHR